MEFEVLKKVTAQILGMDPEEIELDMSFASDLGADSLDLYQIATGIENELSVSFPPEALKNIKTVREAVDLIKRTV